MKTFSKNKPFPYELATLYSDYYYNLLRVNIVGIECNRKETNNKILFLHKKKK